MASASAVLVFPTPRIPQKGMHGVACPFVLPASKISWPFAGLPPGKKTFSPEVSISKFRVEILHCAAIL